MSYREKHHSGLHTCTISNYYAHTLFSHGKSLQAPIRFKFVTLHLVYDCIGLLVDSRPRVNNPASSLKVIYLCSLLKYFFVFMWSVHGILRFSKPTSEMNLLEFYNHLLVLGGCLFNGPLSGTKYPTRAASPIQNASTQKSSLPFSKHRSCALLCAGFSRTLHRVSYFVYF